MKKKVDKRKLMVSIIAGFLAAVLVFGLVASAIPVLAGAERSSDEIMTVYCNCCSHIYCSTLYL